MENSNGHMPDTLHPKTMVTRQQRLGEIILLKRRRLRWTQEDLIEFAGQHGAIITQRKMSAIERGTNEPTWFEMAAIAKAMQCNPMEFDV